jgi:hypothetical protein
MSCLVAYHLGRPGRHVERARMALVEQATPLLAGAGDVAGLDVGWLGLATKADIFDLAGITDAKVAQLAGGHTTKQIPNSWFDSRQPDALVLLTSPGQPLTQPWWAMYFARGVERRVSSLDYWRDCRYLASLALAGTQQSYVIIRCVTRTPAQSLAVSDYRKITGRRPGP